MVVAYGRNVGNHCKNQTKLKDAQGRLRGRVGMRSRLIKKPYKTNGKQHFQLCCKSKPLWAGAGVPDPGREIHDDHLKNLGKTMIFLSCRGNIRGAATRPLLTPGSRTRFTKKPYKTNGKTAFPAMLQKLSGKAPSKRIILNSELICIRDVIPLDAMWPAAATPPRTFAFACGILADQTENATYLKANYSARRLK